MVNILVAEKSRVARQAIVEALGRIDTIAVQGVVAELREAVRSLCRDTPDLVVTGVELADASGLDLIEAARQLSPTSRIVVVGPSPASELWRRQVTTGAIQFVAGPSLDELCDVVAALARPTEDGDDAGGGADDDPLRLLGRITAGVAHDLGNSLSALAAVVALMDAAGTDPALIARARELEVEDQLLELERSAADRRHQRGDVGAHRDAGGQHVREQREHAIDLG